MRLHLPLFETRVGKRIVILFFLCAMLPTALLAWLSYQQIETQLAIRSAERLRHLSKNVGMGLFERLQLATSFVQVRATLLSDIDHPDAVRHLLKDVPPGLLQLTLEEHRARGTHPLAAEAIARMDDGRAVLQVDSSGDLYLGTPVPGPGRQVLWGRLDKDFLFGGHEGLPLLPPDTELCVFTERSRPLICTRPMPIDVAVTDVPDGEFRWRDQGVVYQAGVWNLFLGFEFGAPAWRIVVSEDRAHVLAPIRSAGSTFAWVALLSLSVVAWLSAWLVRRSMDPLRQLQRGTHHIARRDFDHRVTIRSKTRDEFHDLADSFNGMARQMGGHVRALTALNAIDRAVLSALDRDEIVDVILERSGQLLSYDAMAIGLAPADTFDGAWTFSLVADEGHDRVDVSMALTDTERADLDHAPQALGALLFTRLPHGGAISSSMVFPIRVGGKPQGVLLLGFRDREALGEDSLVHVRQLTDQVAVALTNAKLVEQLEQLSWGTMTALARAIDAKSPWTAGHSERVTSLAMALGKRLGLEEGQVEQLHRGGLLHDLGKIGVPAEILDKPGRLTAEERRVMESHPVVGVRILAPITAYGDVLDIVRHHHERWDGAGYPDRLAGHDIPLLARVLAVADIYDAVTSDRPYRPGWNPTEAADHLRREAGRGVDPRIATCFLALLEEQPELADPPGAGPGSRVTPVRAFERPPMFAARKEHV